MQFVVTPSEIACDLTPVINVLPSSQSATSSLTIPTHGKSVLIDSSEPNASVIRKVRSATRDVAKVLKGDQAGPIKVVYGKPSKVSTAKCNTRSTSIAESSSSAPSTCKTGCNTDPIDSLRIVNKFISTRKIDRIRFTLPEFRKRSDKCEITSRSNGKPAYQVTNDAIKATRDEIYDASRKFVTNEHTRKRLDVLHELLETVKVKCTTDCPCGFSCTTLISYLDPRPPSGCCPSYSCADEDTGCGLVYTTTGRVDNYLNMGLSNHRVLSVLMTSLTNREKLILTHELKYKAYSVRCYWPIKR